MHKAGKYSIDRGNRWAYCDVCDMKYHVKDLTLVQDPYNRLFGKLVCRSDYSPTNPQDTPLEITEVLVEDTQKMRPNKYHPYVINPTDIRVPGKVGEGWARLDPLNNSINLTWNAPVDIGSSSIIGYSILRASPQMLVYHTLIENTNNPAPYFNDATSNPSDASSYRVAAINSSGIGEYSDEIWWPIREEYRIIEGEEYLIMMPDEQLILVNDGGIILLQL